MNPVPPFVTELARACVIQFPLGPSTERYDENPLLLLVVGVENTAVTGDAGSVAVQVIP